MRERVLVLAAHPDDETLGVGGTIVRHLNQGDAVRVVVLTDGVTSHHNVKEPQRQAARSAMLVLGVEDLHLEDLPDQRLDSLPLLEVIRVIEKHARDFEPTVVYTHHRGDSNQDHRVVFEASLVAFRPKPSSSVRRLMCYEVPSSTDWGPPFEDWAFLPNVFVDIRDQLDQKVVAFEQYSSTHRSEVMPYPHPRSLESVRLFAKARGSSVGFEAAEAFVLVRELRRS
jgi:LmbE family N-acetylglucosaminyl deacetylase